MKMGNKNVLLRKAAILALSVFFGILAGIAYASYYLAKDAYYPISGNIWILTAFGALIGAVIGFSVIRIFGLGQVKE